MIKIIATLLILISAVSCGRPSSGGRYDPFEKVISTQYSNEPVLLEKQNEKCKQTRFSAGNTHFLLHLLLNGNRVSYAVDFVSLLQGNFLQDRDVILRSIYNEHLELQRIGDLTKSKVISEAMDINFCPEVDGYYQDSIESAALNASHFIKKTSTNFKEAVPDIFLSPITLNISPRIVNTSVERDEDGALFKKSSYLTDNAMYLPYSDTIVFLPQSKELKNRGYNMKFWEVPMVASHEYGHHIFKNIYGISRAGSVHKCFESSKLKEKVPKKNKALALRRVNFDDVLTVFNEGFADLISFYTLSSKERSVRGVNCLQITRDVESSKLINGKRKVFSEENIESFFSPYPDYLNGGCYNPSLQEVHVQGAIFAHSAYKFFQHLNYDHSQALGSLVLWLNYLKDESARLKRMNPQDFFETALDNFFLMSLQKDYRPIDSEICKQIKSIYPNTHINECVTQE